MPSIVDASIKVTSFPNRFVSPFGDDPVVPLYSSTPISIEESNCLPCVVCGNFSNRNKIIQQYAEKFKNYIPNDYSVSVGISEKPPEPPPPPPPPANIYALFVNWE